MNPSAPMHLTVGCAGAMIREKWIEPQPSWSAFRIQRYGYARMSMLNQTTLHFEFVEMDHGSVMDEFYLVKN